MVARVGEALGKVKTLASRLRHATPRTTPSSAVTSGMAAPMTLPKPASSTTTATAKPMLSLITSGGAGRASSPSEPPYSTWTPADRSGATAASTWRR